MSHPQLVEHIRELERGAAVQAESNAADLRLLAEYKQALDAHSIVAVTDSRIESSDHAGIASFAATVEMTGTVLECNGIDLNGETHEGGPFAFLDHGRNRCGCREGTGACIALSVGLTPPRRP